MIQSEEVRAQLANPRYLVIQQAAAAAVQTYNETDGCTLKQACQEWADHYRVDWRDVMAAADPYID